MEQLRKAFAQREGELVTEKRAAMQVFGCDGTSACLFLFVLVSPPFILLVVFVLLAVVLLQGPPRTVAPLIQGLSVAEGKLARCEEAIRVQQELRAKQMTDVTRALQDSQTEVRARYPP